MRISRNSISIFFRASPCGAGGCGDIPYYEIPRNKFYGKTVFFKDFEISKFRDEKIWGAQCCTKFFTMYTMLPWTSSGNSFSRAENSEAHRILRDMVSLRQTQNVSSHQKSHQPWTSSGTDDTLSGKRREVYPDSYRDSCLASSFPKTIRKVVNVAMS